MASALSRLAILATAPIVACASLALAPTAHAVGAGQGDSAPGQAIVRDGLSAATAAASCWDIKQRNPEAADGAYWLQTPAMDHPAQFFCDQTTDGGGWVLIGRGREGWESWSGGKGDPAKLTARSRTSDDFEVVQLSNKAVTELLNNEPVKDQADGVRVMRSWSASGRSYQTMDLQFPKMTDFVWPFKMAHPVNVQLDKGGWRSGLMWGLTGYDNEWNGLQTYPSARTTGWKMGWGYGALASNWTGDVTSATSYFRKSGLTVFPYAEAYVRPRISSDSSAFTRIPNEGLGASTVSAAVSQYAAKTSWGVSGNLNGSVREGNIQVQAFAQVGSTMYVGGNFTGVKQGEKGAEISSRGLAAFDVATGDFTGQTFDFNAQVKALLALPDGRLLVGGDFTRVNGEAHSGTVVINPSTGQIDPSWDLQITNALRGGAVSVRALTYYDGNVYMGGAFTHLSGGGSSRVYARNAGRVSLSGRPDRSWNPEISGAVQAVGVSEANSAFYAGGHFTTAHGNQRAWYAAKFSTQPGAAVDTDFDFVPSSATAGKYQQTIATAGNRVYVGGSEHSLFGYDTATNQRVSGAMTFSNGGDLQATTVSAKGVIYGSCHCSDAAYQDMYVWSMNGSWSRVDEIKWVGAWDAATGESLKWTPFELSSLRKTGAWALTTDNYGNLWVGGDFTLSHTDATRTQWNGGFARYDNRDNVAPEAPSLLRSSASNDSTVTLAWEGVADAVSYEILRDDRPIATSETTSVEVPRGGEDRYFVRAVDAEGNRSATTAVYTAPAPGQADASNPVLLEANATWNYRAEASAAPENWAQASFDDSAWPTGAAPLGYGDSAIATQIATKGSRPVATYYRTHFQVANAKALKGINVKYLADDGAVVYINGVEVDRTRMGAGTVSYATRADSAPNFAAASASLSEVFVPASALKTGDNVIAVETHVNYMRTATVSMQASIFRVEGTPDDNSSVPAERSTEPTDATQPINAASVKSGTVIQTGDEWNYWTSTEAPASDWATTGSLQSWNRGSGPIGWGDSAAVTALDIAKKDRAITYYFARDIDLGAITPNTSLTVKVRADDGVVLRVNGKVIDTKRMSDGNITHTTYANSAVSASKASSDLLEVTIPASLLTGGVNRIGVEEHLNYKGSPSMTFDLNATLVK
ncbi:fibrinogen-like YCDxxxxGGGW domain-containing protein [Pauljensenia sp. UMB0018B]|uniref:Galactose oxidase n=1 Tax=Schaalia odontolytica TaxID=1660 RepID=A0A2I1HYQ2_9ACTO|nr:fibrinogen-like YCDxxxxGGGW domain-containing protein [Schaalia odontolytica]MDK7339731.1 fibrinogen-like YCDxxxxGGGW domain-containing protein [Pauljensenia sp. UMB0018B]PKY64010.1 galactose oxidase [Schaalia odontolytica]